VNGNGAYKNPGVFSTNFIGYAGYVGEGPSGPQCDVSKLPGPADLIAKSTDTEAAQGAVASPGQGPGAAFRRSSAQRSLPSSCRSRRCSDGSGRGSPSVLPP
jgi:hypothetical protein